MSNTTYKGKLFTDTSVYSGIGSDNLFTGNNTFEKRIEISTGLYIGKDINGDLVVSLSSDLSTIDGKIKANKFIGNLEGNADTVTNGVYTTGNQTIAGIKIFNDNVGIGGTPSHNFDILKSKSTGKLGTDNPLYLGSDMGSYVGFNCYRNDSGNFVFGDNSSDDYASVLWFNKANGQLDFYHSITTGNSGETFSLGGIFYIRNNYILVLKNLGIGTTPIEKLHSQGNFLVTGTHGTSPTLSISGAGTRMFFYPGKSAFRAGYVSGIQWNDANIGDYSVAMGYGVTALGTSSVAMGYGVTALGASSVAMGVDTTASGYASVAMGRNSKAIGNYAFAVNLSDATGPDVPANTFRISGATDIGGNVAWTNYSDIRLKTDIKQIYNPLQKVLNLSGVSYSYKDRPEKSNLGFIAQEVQKVCPELVEYDELNDIYSLKESSFTAVIVEAIKEQNNLINNLKDRIKILEEKGE